MARFSVIFVYSLVVVTVVNTWIMTDCYCFLVVVVVAHFCLMFSYFFCPEIKLLNNKVFYLAFYGYQIVICFVRKHVAAGRSNLVGAPTTHHRLSRTENGSSESVRRRQGNCLRCSRLDVFWQYRFAFADQFVRRLEPGGLLGIYLHGVGIPC